VRVRADVEGEPAGGFLVGETVVEPPRVWLTGARSEVMRLNEVVTETVDLTGAAAPIDREVRLSLGGGHVWMEEGRSVRVKIAIEPVEGGRVEADEKRGGRRR
jgi:hypothetical protein